jgi:LysM repeat protein
VALLSDIYSTMYSLKAKTDHYIFQKLEASGTERQTVRQQMETEMPVRSVADINVMIGQTNQNREENGVRLSAEAEVTVVYIADDGGSHSVSGRAAADFQVMLPEGSVCTFDCSSYGERLAAPSAGGLEIRFPVDFHYMALSPRRVAAVSDAMLEEDAPRDTSNQPSVILRMVDQESLWDIAKAHATPIGDIMQANGRPDEDASPGRLLLIPKKR